MACDALVAGGVSAEPEMQKVPALARNILPSIQLGIDERMVGTYGALSATVATAEAAVACSAIAAGSVSADKAGWAHQEIWHDPELWQLTADGTAKLMVLPFTSLVLLVTLLAAMLEVRRCRATRAARQRTALMRPTCPSGVPWQEYWAHCVQGTHTGAHWQGQGGQAGKEAAMTRPPGDEARGSMRSRPTQLTHEGWHARVAAHRQPAEAHCPSRSSA